MWTTAKTPDAVVARLNLAVRTALSQPDVLRAIEADGGEPKPTTPKQTGDFLAQEIDKWRMVIKKAAITVND